MNRIDDARKGYLDKDPEFTRKAHTAGRIDRQFAHGERHMSSFNLPEIILGGQDGLVNVLGIILGMAAATAQSELVIISGLAATFAESISMAAVAYTTRLAEADYYRSEYEREKWEIENIPDGERREIRALYENYGFKGKVLDEIIEKITSDKNIWLRVMMEQELKLSPVERGEAVPAAAVVGASAVVGSLVPLVPFFIFPVGYASVFSVMITSLVLFVVGYYKAKKTLGRQFVRHGIEMMVIGILSAMAGFAIGLIFKAVV